MTLVTISASYGAGGSHVCPALARRLRVPAVDRAIPVAVAERLAVPLSRAHEQDEVPPRLLDRMLRGLAGSSFFSPPAEHALDESAFVRATESVIHEYADRGGAVILGRAGAVVLREDPDAFRVRLDGPCDRRVAQAMRFEGLERAEAERQLEANDRARLGYARHFYGADLRDPDLYHLAIDSTVVPLDVCVEMVLAAVASFSA